MTPERANEIIEQAQAKAKHGPWSDQLKKVMTPEEHATILAVWETMPGNTCYVDALLRIKNKDQNATLQLKPRTTYRDGDGREVCIAGLARYDLEGMPVFWSIQGNHYTVDGRFVHSRQKPGTRREEMDYERFTIADGSRNLVSEDNSPAARKWWEGVEV
jgi:hypothetical protein